MSSRTITSTKHAHRPVRRSGRRTAAAVALGATSILAACSSTSGTSTTASTSGSSGTTAGSTPPGSTPSGTAPSSALRTLDAAAMDQVVKDVATTFHEPGMVVLIRTPQGEYVNTYGTLSIDSTEKPTLDTKVRVGSNTKTWTGTAVLQLVQEGKLKVGDPVSMYRPDVPNGANITIGQLLDMRSGLFNYTDTLALNTALDEEPQKVWTPEQLVTMGLAHPPYFAPGKGWHYSNTNTVLLGLIAEKLDGKPLAQIFQDRLFTPLGLKGTSFPANTDTSIPATFADGYMFGTNVETFGEGKASLSPERLAAIEAGQLKPTNTTHNNPSWTWSAGQGISTANDLATWVKAMVKGDLLDAKTQQVRMDSVKPTDPTKPGAAGYGYGLAKMGPMFGHTGEQPGYNSFMGYDPVNDVTIVTWGNLAPTADGNAPAARLVEKLLSLVYAPLPADKADDIAETSRQEQR